MDSFEQQQQQQQSTEQPAQPQLQLFSPAAVAADEAVRAAAERACLHSAPSPAGGALHARVSRFAEAASARHVRSADLGRAQLTE